MSNPIGNWTLPEDPDPSSHLIAVDLGTGRVRTRCGLEFAVRSYGPIGVPSCENCLRDQQTDEQLIDEAIASERDASPFVPEPRE
jgi:hypothetical protein